MPYQMFGCAFVGLLAGLLPRAAGRREVLMLAVYSSIAYLPGLPFSEQWQRYIAFDLATSLGWDTGRAVTNFVCITLAGPAVLTVFRRAARKARFQAPITFTPPKGRTLCVPSTSSLTRRPPITSTESSADGTTRT